MHCAFKYRLQPNANQERELAIALETHRRLYNACLAQRIKTYKLTQKSVSYGQQSAWYKTERAINPWFAKLNFSSAQATMRRLDRSYQAFFRRMKAGEKPGFPRFKAVDRFDSVTYPSIGDGARVTGKKLRLQHVGLVKVRLHRPIEGTPKTITVAREAGKWYAIVTCEVDPKPLDQSGKSTVGIDVGIERFATLSDGSAVQSLQPLKSKLKTLRVAQRSLARKTKGKNRRKKQRQIVAKLHRSVANYRRDQHHKIARSFVRRYSAFAVESLNIQGMSRNHRLARAVLDSGWNQFLQVLRHKAESAGAPYVEVNARGTSQTCPRCGIVEKKKLSQRKHSCPCGYETHRDHAAAEVILQRSLGWIPPESLNVNTGLHDSRSRLL